MSAQKALQGSETSGPNNTYLISCDLPDKTHSLQLNDHHEHTCPPGNQPHHLPHHRTLGWLRQSATSPPPESPFRPPWLPLRPHPTLPRDQPFKGCFSSRVAPGAVLSPLTPSPHSLPGQADSGRQQPQPYSYDGQRTKWLTQVRNMDRLPSAYSTPFNACFWCRFLFRQAPK